LARSPRGRGSEWSPRVEPRDKELGVLSRAAIWLQGKARPARQGKARPDAANHPPHLVSSHTRRCAFGERPDTLERCSFVAVPEGRSSTRPSPSPTNPTIASSSRKYSALVRPAPELRRSWQSAGPCSLAASLAGQSHHHHTSYTSRRGLLFLPTLPHTF